MYKELVIWNKIIAYAVKGRIQETGKFKNIEKL